MYTHFAVITLIVTAAVAFSAEENREQTLAYAEAQQDELASAAAQKSAELADTGMAIRDETYDGRAATISYDSEYSGSDTGSGGGGGIRASGSGRFYGPQGEGSVPPPADLAAMGLTRRQWDGLTPEQRRAAMEGLQSGSAAIRKAQAAASARRAGATSTADAPD